MHHLVQFDRIAGEYLRLGPDQNALLKLDVQGYEMDVLEGAKETLAQIQGLQLEVSLVPLYQGEIIWSEMLDYVRRLGYNIHWLKPSFFDNRTGQMLQIDALFFKH